MRMKNLDFIVTRQFSLGESFFSVMAFPSVTLGQSRCYIFFFVSRYHESSFILKSLIVFLYRK